MLCLDDLFVLAVPMKREVQRSLPMPAAVSFCVVAADGSLQPLSQPVGAPAADPALTAGLNEPKLLDGSLLLPLSLPSGEQAAMVISEVDPALLKKMSPDWLQTLQENLPDQFETVRMAHVDVDTELYNRRAAELYFRQAAAGSRR